MKVLIVGKTRMRNGLCIGAIAEKGQSLRLDSDSDYQVGQIWDIDYTLAPRKPPHTEDVIVNSKKYINEYSVKNQVKVIESYMPPTIGHPQNLYEGLLQIDNQRGRRALYIAEQSGVPSYSTTFWRPNEPLTCLTEEELYGKRYNMDRVRRFYRYPTENGGCTLAFVGFQEALEIIPADTLVRVSLAGWWLRQSDVEERCYAQLSGWYL